jgi:pyruvate dehydrogenase E1 component alpha subunit
MLARTELLELYRRIASMRRFDERTADFDQLLVGAEAVVAGVVAPLRETDHLVSTFGAAAHRLARGAELGALVTAGSSDAARAKLDQELRFTSGGLECAVALARAIEDRDGAIVCCVFGDERLARGVFHESMNEAANARLPIVFVCENNFYGMGTLFDGAICQEDLYRFAAGYKMPSARVDGTQLLEVHTAALKAFAYARAGEGPSLIDAVTYHPRGAKAEPRDFKSPHQEMILRDRDPLRNFRARIVEAHPSAESALEKIDESLGRYFSDRGPR